MCKRWQQNIIKNKERKKEKHVKTIKISLKKNKTEIVSMPVIDTEIFFKESELKRQEKKKKRQYAHSLYNTIHG